MFQNQSFLRKYGKPQTSVQNFIFQNGTLLICNGISDTYKERPCKPEHRCKAEYQFNYIYYYLLII